MTPNAWCSLHDMLAVMWSAGLGTRKTMTNKSDKSGAIVKLKLCRLCIVMNITQKGTIRTQYIFSFLKVFFTCVCVSCGKAGFTSSSVFSFFSAWAVWSAEHWQNNPVVGSVAKGCFFRWRHTCYVAVFILPLKSQGSCYFAAVSCQFFRHS